MIIYNLTINIDESVHNDWLEWMKSNHIPDVMRTGMFKENKLLRLLGDDHLAVLHIVFNILVKTWRCFNNTKTYTPLLLEANITTVTKISLLLFAHCWRQ